MNEQTRGVVAATLWDLRAHCEAQLRVVAGLQQTLASSGEDAAVEVPDHHLGAGLVRLRHLALEMAGHAERCRRRLVDEGH